MNGSVLNLEGNNYEVGLELGKWWVERITQLEFRGYKSLLESKQFETKYFPLMDYAYRNFPDLMSEIKGMADGIFESGWKTSIGNVFLNAIGENWGCSSFIMRKNHSILMGHNEEDERIYPMCAAKVKLIMENHKEPIKFASVSYPFQLFGSVGGMNRHIAFQGNSIGTKGQYRKLMNTWEYRAPKTFLTRKMLECTDMGEIGQLYGSHHSTLPSHHFIAMSNNAYSLKIRPIIDIAGTDVKVKDQFKIEELLFNEDCPYHAHTNHFVIKDSEEEKVDAEWSWKGNYMMDSEKRLKALKKLLSRMKAKVNLNVDDILKELKLFKAPWNDVTSASLSFRVCKDAMELSIKRYFENGRTIHLSIR